MTRKKKPKERQFRLPQEYPTYINEELEPRLRKIDERMYSSIRLRLLVNDRHHLATRPLKTCPNAPARAARRAKAAK